MSALPDLGKRNTSVCAAIQNGSVLIAKVEGSTFHLQGGPTFYSEGLWREVLAERATTGMTYVALEIVGSAEAGIRWTLPPPYRKSKR